MQSLTFENDLTALGGYGSCNAQDGVWSVARGSLTGTLRTSTGTSYIQSWSEPVGGSPPQIYHIERGILSIDCRHNDLTPLRNVINCGLWFTRFGLGSGVVPNSDIVLVSNAYEPPVTDPYASILAGDLIGRVNKNLSTYISIPYSLVLAYNSLVDGDDLGRPLYLGVLSGSDWDNNPPNENNKFTYYNDGMPPVIGIDMRPDISIINTIKTGADTYQVSLKLNKDDGADCSCYLRIWDEFEDNELSTTTPLAKSEGDEWDVTFTQSGAFWLYAYALNTTYSSDHWSDETDLTTVNPVTVYPADSMTRVTGLKHIYKNALINGETIYRLQHFLGGLAYFPANSLEDVFNNAISEYDRNFRATPLPMYDKPYTGGYYAPMDPGFFKGPTDGGVSTDPGFWKGPPKPDYPKGGTQF